MTIHPSVHFKENTPAYSDIFNIEDRVYDDQEDAVNVNEGDSSYICSIRDHDPGVTK